MDTFYPLAFIQLNIFDKMLLFIVILMVSTIMVKFVKKEN